MERTSGLESRARWVVEGLELEGGLGRCLELETVVVGDEE